MSIDARVLFDDKFSDLLGEIKESGFLNELAQIALFCASLGAFNNQRFSGPVRGTKSVRFYIVSGLPGASEFVDALYLLKSGDNSFDPLREETRLERIRLFESFVNGGLEALQTIRSHGKPMSVAIPEIINQHWGQ